MKRPSTSRAWSGDAHRAARGITTDRPRRRWYPRLRWPTAIEVFGVVAGIGAIVIATSVELWHESDVFSHGFVTTDARVTDCWSGRSAACELAYELRDGSTERGTVGDDWEQGATVKVDYALRETSLVRVSGEDTSGDAAGGAVAGAALLGVGLVGLGVQVAVWHVRSARRRH